MSAVYNATLQATANLPGVQRLGILRWHRPCRLVVVYYEPLSGCGTAIVASGSIWNWLVPTAWHSDCCHPPSSRFSASTSGVTVMLSQVK